MTARTEHQNLLIKYKGYLYLLCDNNCYEIYKFLEEVGIRVIERGFTVLDYFQGKNFLELANYYRPDKAYYNLNPKWSDYCEVYIHHTTDGQAIIYGDLDGIENDILVSYKPNRDCPDVNNHRIYYMLKRDYGLDFTIKFDLN